MRVVLCHCTGSTVYRVATRQVTRVWIISRNGFAAQLSLTDVPTVVFLTTTTPLVVRCCETRGFGAKGEGVVERNTITTDTNEKH